MRRFIVLKIVVLGLILVCASVAWAKEPATPEMTVQQAISSALSNSNALKLKENSIDRASKLRDSAAEDMNGFIPTGETTPQAEAAYSSLVQKDNAWQTAKKSYKTQEDTVVMSVYQAYNNVLLAQEKIKSAEAALESAQWQKRLVAACYAVGMASKTDVIQADATLAGASAALESDRQSLEDCYQQFNQLVGLEPVDRPVLIDQPVYSALVIDNLNVEVERVLEVSPDVWTAEQQISLAKITLNLWAPSTSSDPYDAKEIDLLNANISATVTKDEIDKAVRSLYYKIIQQESTFVGLQEQIKTSEENLRVIKVKYDLGMATQAEVVQAKAALASQQLSLLSAICQHEISKMAFRKPWAAA